MSDQRKCCECGTAMRFQTTSQTFEHEGAEVEVTGIPANVCPNCGHTAYSPGTADHVAAAARAMFAMVRRQGGGKTRLRASPAVRPGRKRHVQHA